MSSCGNYVILGGVHCLENKASADRRKRPCAIRPRSLVEGPTPEYLWDLEERHVDAEKFELVAGDTFDLYKNVLSGTPEPIDIAFTFYRVQL